MGVPEDSDEVDELVSEPWEEALRGPLATGRRREPAIGLSTNTTAGGL